MDGIIFYWIFWIYWVVFTFLMNKTKLRTMASFLLLLTIILSGMQLNIGEFIVNSSFLVLWGSSFIYMTKNNGSKLLYYLFASLIITIGYVGFHLFELIDPVWLIFKREWMVALAILYLTIMLVKEPIDRIVIGILSICNGEVLFSIILNNFFLFFEIGSFQFLDSLAIVLVLISSWRIFERLALYMDASFGKGMKERQG